MLQTLPHFLAGAALVSVTGYKSFVVMSIGTSALHIMWALGYQEKFLNKRKSTLIKQN